MSGLKPENGRKIIAGAAICAVIIIVFIAAGCVFGSPERTVRKFVEASLSGEWDRAFRYIDIPDGEFMTEALFEQAFADGEISGISDFEAQEDEYDDSDISRTYYITYYVNGEAKSTASVEIVKAGRLLLFWNNYKVSAGDIVAKNLMITVNQGSRLYIDDVEVGDGYICDDGGDSDSPDSQMYKLDYVFMGYHKLRAESDIYEDVEKEQTLSSQEWQKISLTSSEVKEEIVEERELAAQNDMKTFFAAAIAGEDFSAIEPLCVTDSSAQKKIQWAYDKFLSRTYNDGYGIIGIDYDDMTTEASSGINPNDGRTYVKVSVTADVKVRCRTESGIRNKNTAVTHSYTYAYTDGQWKICAVALKRIFCKISGSGVCRSFFCA